MGIKKYQMALYEIRRPRHGAISSLRHGHQGVDKTQVLHSPEIQGRLNQEGTEEYFYQIQSVHDFLSVKIGMTPSDDDVCLTRMPYEVNALNCFFTIFP
jgi:hypothetical protein